MLDHPLKGDVYESVIIGFLAAIRVDERNSTLLEAFDYPDAVSFYQG